MVMSSMVQISSYSKVKDRMFASLNRKFHLSPNENIVYHRANGRHSLFDFYNIKNIFCHLERKINYKAQFCFDRAVSGQRSP